VSVPAYYLRGGGRRSARAIEDERLLERIRELHAGNENEHSRGLVPRANSCGLRLAAKG
jgi:hypothetical protein